MGLNNFTASGLPANEQGNGFGTSDYPETYYLSCRRRRIIGDG